MWLRVRGGLRRPKVVGALARCQGNSKVKKGGGGVAVGFGCVRYPRVTSIATGRGTGKAGGGLKAMDSQARRGSATDVEGDGGTYRGVPVNILLP